MKEYIVIKPERNCGMCGYIWQTIRAMYQHPNHKYYVDFGNSIYKTGNDNIWNYFFLQPHSATRPPESEIEKEVGIIFDAESEFVWSLLQPNTEEDIKANRRKFADVISKNIRLHPQTQSKVDEFCVKNFAGKRVLGVHFRGTDHPNKKHMTHYLQTIKEQLVNYDVLFVASDEYDRFRLAQVTFGDKVVYYDSLRSKGPNTPLHCDAADGRYTRDGSFQYQYKIAEDVIIEAYLMSRVDFLMCCPGSNVSYFARAINPELPAVEL